MKDQITKLLLFLTFGLLLGCHSDEQAMLTLWKADKQLSLNEPDSAKVLLGQIKDPSALSKKNYAYWLLLNAATAACLEEDVPFVFQMDKAVHYYSQQGTPIEHAKSLLYLGLSFEQEKELDKAMQYYLSAKEIAEQTQDYKLAGEICNRAAGLYDFEDYFEDAKRFYQCAADNFLLAKDSSEYVYALRNIGSILHKKDKMEEALEYYKKAYDLSLQIGDSYLLSSLSNRIGVAYQYIDSLGLAEKYLFQSMAYEEEGSAPTYLALSRLYMTQNKYDKVALYLYKASHSETTNKMTEGAVYYRYYLFEKWRHNYSKALAYYEQYVTFTDSISDMQEKANVLRVEKRYDQSHLLNKNFILQTEKERAIFVCVFLAFSCLFVILLYKYSSVSKNEKLLQQQRELQESHVAIQEKEFIVRGIESDIQQIRENILHKSDVWSKVLKNSQDIEFAKKKPLTEKDWLALVEIVKVTYVSFFEKLQSKFSGLSDEEVRFCCLLKIGLDSQQLAILLNIQPTSISHKRYRIMKKGGFAKTNTTLEEIIREL